MAVFSPALALPVDAPLANPAEEARARALFRELRCAVCQSESIADSDAAVAADLRREVRARVVAGDDNDAIKAGLSARYGDAILMRPPFSAATFLLWLGPGLIVIFAMALALGYFRHREIPSSHEGEG